MSHLNLNATQDESQSSLNISRLSDSSIDSTDTANQRKKLNATQERTKRRRCNRLVFGSIIAMLIFVCLVNGIRGLAERYPAGDFKFDNKTLCDFGDNFINLQPCWQDYQPKAKVAEMKSIYEAQELGAGNAEAKKLTLRDIEFNNPLPYLVNETQWYGAYLFKGLLAPEEYYLQDIYIMPINEEDVESLNNTQFMLELDPEDVDEEDLLVPGFTRVIKYCNQNESAECKKTGIVEISETYQASIEEEYKRIIDLEHNNQIFERQFADCHVGDLIVKQKRVEMNPIGAAGTYIVQVYDPADKKTHWLKNQKLMNLDCDQEEIFDLKDKKEDPE